MVLESKAAMTAAAILGAGVIAAWNSLGPWAQDLVLAAAAIAAFKVVGGALRRVFTIGVEVHDAVTSKLPTRVDGLEREARELREELIAVHATLEVYGTTEAASVRGALAAAGRVRSPRATDPAVRTGWRE